MWPSAQYMYGVGVFVLVVAVFHVVRCSLVHSHVWCGSVCTSDCCISCGTVWPSAQYMYGVGVFVLVVVVFHVVRCSLVLQYMYGVGVFVLVVAVFDVVRCGLVHSTCMVWECLY